MWGGGSICDDDGNDDSVFMKCTLQSEDDLFCPLPFEFAAANHFCHLQSMSKRREIMSEEEKKTAPAL